MHNINKNLDAEMVQFQSQIRRLTLERDTERARLEEAEKKLEATDDCIVDMYMGLQHSIMFELHQRDPTKDYRQILDMILDASAPANEESHQGDGKDASQFLAFFALYFGHKGPFPPLQLFVDAYCFSCVSIILF